MATQAIANTEKPRSIRDLIGDDKFQRALKQICARSLDPSRLTRVVLASFQQTPKLLDCTPQSVMLSILQAGAMGLEPDGGTLGQGYLVPFWSKKRNTYECQFIPGYRGVAKLCRNSGEIADVWAEVVYEHDEFEYELGLEQQLRHKRNDTIADPGKLTYAYAVARFRDGTKKFVVMPSRDVLAIKANSPSKDKSGKVVGPWVDHEAEMWKKTALKRLAKYLPQSVDPVANQVLMDDRDDVRIDVDVAGMISHDIDQGEETTAHPAITDGKLFDASPRAEDA